MFIPPYDLLAVIRKMCGNVSFFNPASGKPLNLLEKRLVMAADRDAKLWIDTDFLREISLILVSLHNELDYYDLVTGGRLAGKIGGMLGGKERDDWARYVTFFSHYRKTGFSLQLLQEELGFYWEDMEGSQYIEVYAIGILDMVREVIRLRKVMPLYQRIAAKIRANRAKKIRAQVLRAS